MVVPLAHAAVADPSSTSIASMGPSNRWRNTRRSPSMSPPVWRSHCYEGRRKADDSILNGERGALATATHGYTLRMARPISAPRGTRDLLPEDGPAWSRIEEIARDLSERYAFDRIETPVFERIELFSRGLGESSAAVG